MALTVIALSFVPTPPSQPSSCEVNSPASIEPANPETLMSWKIVDCGVFGPPAKNALPAPGGAWAAVGKLGEPYRTTVKLEVRFQDGLEATTLPSFDAGPSSALQLASDPLGGPILLTTPPATLRNSSWPPLFEIAAPSPKFQTPEFRIDPPDGLSPP